MLYIQYRFRSQCLEHLPDLFGDILDIFRVGIDAATLFDARISHYQFDVRHTSATDKGLLGTFLRPAMALPMRSSLVV